jgi:pimeloyl-ACP methyl ester carboxylesterase
VLCKTLRDFFYCIFQAVQHLIQRDDGMDIIAWCKGKGPDILLLHSTGGSSAQFSFLFKRLVSKGFRLIAYDMRGHGMSSTSTTYSIADLVSDLESVLVHFNCENATIVGYGMGGYVAQSLFLHHPKMAQEKISRLVLLSSFSFSPCCFVERFFLVLVSSGLLHIICKSKYLSRNVGQRLFGKAVNKTMLEEWRRSVLRTKHQAWTKVAAASRNDLRNCTGLISIPTLILCGDFDIFYSSIQKTHFPHLKGNSERIWLDRMGNMTPWEAPDRLTTMLCRFVPSFVDCKHATSSHSPRALSLKSS